MKAECFTSALEAHQDQSTESVRRGISRKINSGVLGAMLSLGLFYYPRNGHSGTVSNSHSVTLAWEESRHPKVAGYCIYYGVTSGNYTNRVRVGKVTTNTVAGLASGMRYYFAVKAIVAVRADNADIEHATIEYETSFSNEVTVVLEDPAVQVNITANRHAVLTVKGLTDQTYRILASTNLTTWAAIGTVTIGASGSTSFTDTNAPSFPKRFYRTLTRPMGDKL